MANYTLIERRADLDELVEHLLGEKVVSFDTEADSFYHYFDKTCLVQVATRNSIYLIDPLALGGPDKLAPLAPVFASPEIRKIFHAAEYDIYVLKRDCGFEFKNLFDTMISSQLLGYSSIGLAAIIERHFDVSLPKDEQRSDWSLRPLRQSQLDYAAADAAYLIRLAEKLERELKKLDRLSWAQEEFENLAKRSWPERQFDKLGYIKIKGARILDPKSLGVLRELFLARDAKARTLDRPPFKVLSNRTLMEIAQRQPENAEQLAEIKGVTELLQRRLGREVLAAVARGVKKRHGPIPKVVGGGRRRMDRRTERRMAELKRWRDKRASSLKLDPGVYCPNATLEAIAICNPSEPDELRQLPELKGWFVREFAEELTEFIVGLPSQGAEAQSAKK